MNRRLAAACFIGAFALLAPRLATAEEPAEHGDSSIAGRLPVETQLHPAVVSTHPLALNDGGSGKLTIYFVGLIGLVAGGYFIIKKGLPMLPARIAGGSEHRLHLRETKMLGNRQFLVVAEYEGNKILLGVGPGRIEYLCPLDGGGGDEPSDMPLPPRGFK